MAQDEAPDIRVPPYLRQATRRQCGLFCLYAAARHLKRELDFETLLRGSYIDLEVGSSIDDLIRGATEFGLHATALSNLSWAGLERLGGPAILHVRLEDSVVYDHYLLVLSISDGKALTYDPPRRYGALPSSLVSSRWNGKVVLLSEAPFDVASILFRTRFEHYALLSCAIASGILLCWLRRRWAKGRARSGGCSIAARCTLQAVALVGLGAVLGFFYHSVAEMGLLRDSAHLWRTVLAYRTCFLDHCTASDVRQALHTNAVVLVDSSPPYKYSAGHIPGALNLPVNSTTAEREQVLSQIPPGQRVVVYCQDSGCRCSEGVARLLLEKGHSNLSLCGGCWKQW